MEERRRNKKPGQPRNDNATEKEKLDLERDKLAFEREKFDLEKRKSNWALC